ncbi:hypothetical protein PIROE2DRAFT_16325 [Piromyces sp. E2]|nr:hypothetical protein PIROE2DRAFT_16325 [Piromyces sp. E2]|eukprot:OUM58399.1 hypothetical protein PIROE2DRAFT_16325 [Piromyces sp. E2]
MYTSSLSQPDSLKQNDEDDLYGGSFSLSQPNLTYRSPLVSPNHSPLLSSFQSNMVLPTTTAAVVMTKTFENDGRLSPVKDHLNSFLATKSLSLDSYNRKSNYYVTPSETPKMLSPVLGNKKLEDPFAPSVSYYPLSTDNPGKRKNSGEKRVRKKSVVHALENIIEPNHQSDPQQSESKKSKFERRFQEYQLQDGKKCKVIYEGQFSRWIEEDPFSIYSDDVTRFSTEPSSTVKQRNDLSFERIVSQNNNGYWQKSNFLITRNEIILFPNAKWDNRVVEVMTITDDINISISSILIAKLEWIIEVKISESNVYTQSNFIYQAYKSVDNASSHDDVKTDGKSAAESTPVKTNKDTKSGEGNNNTNGNASTNPSRQVKWILKFYDRESMLYFISLIKYIQTKKIKKLVNEEEEWGSLESDISSFSSEENEENQENANVVRGEPSQTTVANGYENITSPTSKFLSLPASLNEIGQSPPPRRERTSSLGDRFYTGSLERRGSTRNNGVFSPVLETADEYINVKPKTPFIVVERKRSYNGIQRPTLEEKQPSTAVFAKEKRKNAETSSNDVNALLKDSIHKAEVEIMKLQNWRRNRSNSLASNQVGESTTTGKDEGGGEEQDKLGSPKFSSMKTNWQSSNRTRKSRITSWNPNSSTAIFTNIQLSYLDMLENKAKNRIIKLNRNSATSDKDNNNLIHVKVTDTEESNPVPATEEDHTKTENKKRKGFGMPPRLQRSSSLKDKDFAAGKRGSLSPHSKSHPIAIPFSSPSSSSKYNSISTVETGMSDGSSNNILRKGSNNSSTFYSPRSSSLFMEDVNNTLQKGSVGSQKRLSGVMNMEKKTNSMLTNFTSTSASSDAALMEQKSSYNELNPFPYGMSLSDGEGKLQRNSFQSNVSHNSLEESNDHTGQCTTKSTPEIGQVTAMLRKNSLEGVEMSIPPLNDGGGDTTIPHVGVSRNGNNGNFNTKIHPMRTTSIQNLCIGRNSTELLSPPVSPSMMNVTPAVGEGRPRSGSKSYFSALYRSNSAKKNLETTASATANTNDNMEKEPNTKRISNSSGNEPVYGQDGNYLPYMMDLKSSNELYLASLQQHFQQQIQPSVMPHSPLLNHLSVHSQPQSPRIPSMQPHLSNSVINESLYKSLGSYGNRNNARMMNNSYEANTNEFFPSKSPILQYMNAEGQLVTFELNDESLIPTSFLRNYPKRKTMTLDPIILNSLQILNILEQTYL